MIKWRSDANVMQRTNINPKIQILQIPLDCDQSVWGHCLATHLKTSTLPSAQYGLSCHQKNTYFTRENLPSYFRYNNLKCLESFWLMRRCVTRNKMRYWRMLSGWSSSISLTMKFGFRNYFRQADKNGDGKISVEEIITIFKVRWSCRFTFSHKPPTNFRWMTSPVLLARWGLLSSRQIRISLVTWTWQSLAIFAQTLAQSF